MTHHNANRYCMTLVIITWIFPYSVCLNILERKAFLFIFVSFLSVSIWSQKDWINKCPLKKKDFKQITLYLEVKMQNYFLTSFAKWKEFHHILSSNPLVWLILLLKLTFVQWSLFQAGWTELLYLILFVCFFIHLT